jgi:hypothetical protein
MNPYEACDLIYEGALEWLALNKIPLTNEECRRLRKAVVASGSEAKALAYSHYAKKELKALGGPGVRANRKVQ